MSLSTLDLSIFGFTLDGFIIVVIIAVLVLVVFGIVLMARNVRPILGLLLLIFAIAMIIGVSYDADGIRREVNKLWGKVSKEQVEQEETNSVFDD